MAELLTIPQLAQESLGWKEIIAAESNLSSFFTVEVGLTRCQATSDLGSSGHRDSVPNSPGSLGREEPRAQQYNL